MASVAIGCDLGDQKTDPSQGPGLRLVGTYPADGAGTECLPGAAEDCGVPIDATIELRFDRPLLPSTAIRQSIYFYAGYPSQNQQTPDPFAPAPVPVYDVVERVLTFRLAEGQTLEPSTLYTVELPVPNDEVTGLRAFDGAPLSDSGQPLRFSFYTSSVSEPEAEPEPLPTCSDVLAIFGANWGRCTSCHSPEPPSPAPGVTPAPGAVMGLDLSSGNGLLATAIGRVAHQADIGTNTGETLEDPVRFGVGMPLIDPGRADNSYLLYKLLISDENYLAGTLDPDVCQSRYRAPTSEACLPLPPDEISRLRSYFVRGDSMPLNGGAIYRQALFTLQDWIAAGAECE